MPPELSVIVPCYNERANVRPLVGRLEAALAGIAWEAVFVDDDSPDGTAAEARALAAADAASAASAASAGAGCPPPWWRARCPPRPRSSP